MKKPLLVAHEHTVYRVVRRRWADPLDASYSQTRSDNRWNTPAFPALYACCSRQVARAVALDVLRLSGVELEDLQAAVQPALVEITWSGTLVDVASPPGVAAAGFPTTYPSRISIADTQKAAAAWHAAGMEGIVCRSASLARLGFSDWQEPHPPWGEVAIFPQNAGRAPRKRKTHSDLDWLRVAPRRSLGDTPTSSAGDGGRGESSVSGPSAHAGKGCGAARGLGW